MKVLFYSPVSLRHGGGCERWQLNMVPLLAKFKEVEIKVITLDYQTQNLSLPEVDNKLGKIEHWELPAIKLGGLVIPTRESLVKIKQLLTWSEVVHFVYGFFGHDWLLAKLTKKLNVKVLVGVHAPLLTASTIHNLYVRLISRPFILPRFSGFMVFNAEQAKILKQWFTRPIFFVGGGVDRRLFKTKKTFQTSKLIFGYLGRLESEKGVDILAEAINHFLAKNAPARVEWQIAGTGSDIKYVELLLNKHPSYVKYLGYVHHPEKILPRFTVLVLPSRQESFGISAIEAMSVGVPVLSSRAEGPKSFIRENSNGWLISQLTAAELAHYMTKIYNLWQKNTQFTKKMIPALTTTANKYSLSAVSKKVYLALSELYKTSHPG